MAEAYLDLRRLEEDKRIDMIGHTVMVHKKTAAVITDSDPGKLERYIAKLKKRFPGIVVLGKDKGPVANTVYVKLGPPSTEAN